jgi:biotin synthase-like enzyme
LTGGLSFQFISLQQLVDRVRFKFPKIKIIVGGGVITGCPQIAMQAFENKVDVGMIGEGEVTV